MEVLNTSNPAMNADEKKTDIVQYTDDVVQPTSTSAPAPNIIKTTQTGSNPFLHSPITPSAVPTPTPVPAPEAERWVKIDTAENRTKEEQNRINDNVNKRQEAQMGSMADLAAAAIEAEAARDNQAAENLQSEEYVESLKEPLSGPNGDKVVYSSIPAAVKKKQDNATIFDDGSAYDDTDLLPSYDEDEEVEATAEEEAIPDPSDQEKYGEYIRSLETAITPAQEKQVVKEVKSRNVEIVPVSKDKMRTAGDQSFLNAVNKFKKDNFAVVSVPLVNSGFNASIVGTGVVDLNNLYLKVDQNTTMLDYQAEQMKVIMKNIVGTNPKINPNNLRNSIHFQDFQMMAFGHICATLSDVETVTNCTECGKPFHITSKPYDLLMNMDELAEAAAKIENAPSVDEISLLSKTTVVRTDDNITIYLGHPSYSESIRMMSAFRNYADNMSKNEQRRFEAALRVLYMIRKVELPGGMMSSNIYQNYMALTLLSNEDMNFLEREIDKMYKQIIMPRFGIKEVTCPHCKKVNTNIAYENLTDLLFYHTTVSSYLEKPEV